MGNRASIDPQVSPSGRDRELKTAPDTGAVFSYSNGMI